MTSFTPIVSVEDLSTYLNDSTLDATRAALLIEQSQKLCATIVNPLPDDASIIVMRVAGRAYVTITSARQAQAAAASMPYGATQGGLGGVWLSRADKADLRRMASGSNAFSINMLGPDYSVAMPPWDINTTDPQAASS